MNKPRNTKLHTGLQAWQKQIIPNAESIQYNDPDVAHHCRCYGSVRKCGSTTTLQLSSLSGQDHEDSKAFATRGETFAYFLSAGVLTGSMFTKWITNLCIYLEAAGPPRNVPLSPRTGQWGQVCCRLKNNTKWHTCKTVCMVVQWQYRPTPI